MSMINLHIAKEVAAGTEDCVSHTPTNGKTIRVSRFYGEAAFSKNSAVKLVWDYEGAGEEILWAFKGGDPLPHELRDSPLLERIGDGVKKIAVCLDNGETGAVILAGFAMINEED